MNRWVHTIVLMGSLLWLQGCALKLEAKLLQPWNRDVDAKEGEQALIAKARYMLLAQLPDEYIMQNLQDQGLTVEEARRILALARAKK